MEGERRYDSRSATTSRRSCRDRYSAPNIHNSIPSSAAPTTGVVAPTGKQAVPSVHRRPLGLWGLSGRTSLGRHQTPACRRWYPSPPAKARYGVRSARRARNADFYVSGPRTTVAASGAWTTNGRRPRPSVPTCVAISLPENSGGEYGSRSCSARSSPPGARSAQAWAWVKKLQYRLDVNTLHRDESSLGLNDVGRVRLRTTVARLAHECRRNRQTGGFISIDDMTSRTVGAGMIMSSCVT